MHLVPGGRFLVTMAYERRWLDVWDLGEVGRKPLMMPRFVVKIEEEGQTIRSFVVEHTRRTIIIAVMYAVGTESVFVPVSSVGIEAHIFTG